MAWRLLELLGTKTSEAPVLIPIFAILVPVLGNWWVNRRIAREKATIDLIEKFESTEHYRDSKNCFYDLVRKGDGLDLYAKPKNQNNQDVRRQILTFLNHYELVALCIESKLLSGKFYRKWMGTALVDAWNTAAPDFIYRARWKRKKDRWKYDPKPFRALEKLACRWEKDAVSLRNIPHIAPSDLDVSPGDFVVADLVGEASLQPADVE